MAAETMATSTLGANRKRIIDVFPQAHRLVFHGQVPQAHRLVFDLGNRKRIVASLT
jgi:hypothetical protein